MEPEATFVWKGEEGGGLKLDKVKNYEEFGLPLTDMKLHKKWRSNRARRIYFKEPTLDLCRMRNNDQESSFEDGSKFFLPGFKVPTIHHSEFEEPVLLHLESGEPILVQKVGGGRRRAKIDFDAQYLRLCNLLPLNQDPAQVNMSCYVCPQLNITQDIFWHNFDTDVCGDHFGGDAHISAASCAAGDPTGQVQFSQ